MYFDKVVFVETLVPYASDANKEGFVSCSGFVGPGGIKTSAIRMNIQPMSDQMTILIEGVIGKTFVGYTTASGLVEGMRVTVSGRPNEQYDVQGRKNYDYSPIQYNEVTLFKRDPL